MSFASAAIIGYFFGFSLGVGCALAVMYSIYSGGYRRAVEDSLRSESAGTVPEASSRSDARVGGRKAEIPRLSTLGLTVLSG